MKPPENSKVQRFSLASIAEQILAQVNLEKGLGYAFKKLVLNPGELIYEYLFVDRHRSIKPLAILLLTVGLATFISLKFLPGENLLMEELAKDPKWTEMPEFLRKGTELLSSLLAKYFNLFYMISLPGMAIGSYLVFNQYRLNFAEHLVINTYLFSFQTVIYIITFPILMVKTWVVILQAVCLGFYTAYYYKKVFNLNWKNGIIRSLLVYLLTQVYSSIIVGIFYGVIFFLNF